MRSAHPFSHDRLLHLRQAPQSIQTYIHHRDIWRCKNLHRVVCDKVCTYIAGATVCFSCEAGKFSGLTAQTSWTSCTDGAAGKYQATAGAESVCMRGREGKVVCVHACVFVSVCVPICIFIYIGVCVGVYGVCVCVCIIIYDNECLIETSE